MMCYNKGTLQAFLDKELPAKEMDAVGEHLLGCAACRLTLEELESNAAYVDAAIKEYTAGVVFGEDAVKSGWERFKEKRVRRGRRHLLTTALRSRRIAAVAAAASLIVVFIMGSFVMGPEMQRKAAEVEAPLVEEQAAKPASDEKDRHGAPSPLEEPLTSGNWAPEGSGAPRMAAPYEERHGKGEAVPDTLSAVGFGISPHTPIDPATVCEVSYSAADGAPVPVTDAEREQLVARFNSGTVTGPRLRATEEQQEQAGAVLRFTLADGTVIAVVYLNAEEVAVERPEGSYSLRSPELASFLYGSQ